MQVSNSNHNRSNRCESKLRENLTEWFLFSVRCVRRTNRRAIAMMFVRLSVCLGRARQKLIIRCTLARIQVYSWTGYCSGHPGTKACPPIFIFIHHLM